MKRLTKKQGEILALIQFDLGCVVPSDKQSKYYLSMAEGNLYDLLKQLKIKPHGEEYED